MAVLRSDRWSSFNVTMFCVRTTKEKHHNEYTAKAYAVRRQRLTFSTQKAHTSIIGITCVVSTIPVAGISGLWIAKTTNKEAT